ncbi:probable protein phosphatase 2C 47 isoform X2 [Camellia sinensis]|uniref:probable protein phosphatase 2C 47 isoform X2 n=1 Tax=Camellia sinensis TaxID=4442 RepID=UPI0010364D2C|nr:probable protein phosphatase 2C 47 isoform X2 [Camellia sinensis]
MAPATDTPPHCTELDGGFCKENNVSAMEDEDPETSDNSSQAKAGKPPAPRNLSVMRHSMSQAILAGTADVVFDGHGGVDAASFTRKNILDFIVEDSHFPTGVKRAIRNAFVKADHALADAKSLDSSSGTTALTCLILGRTMLIANAGDSRAVLGKRGRAIELSKDHKPNCTSERLRIEKLGGVIYDGYLNGQLSVARALGDWHLKGPKGSLYPLSSEPELEEIVLTEEDEFLIMGCDGLWDVMSSQYAVTIVRRELMLHNDPEKCTRELVREALKRNTCDNLTVLVVCFSPDPPPRIEVPKSQRRRSISAEGLDLLKGVLSNV